MLKLKKSEEYVIRLLRELKPYEKVEIIADKMGKPYSYLICREQKILATELGVTNLRIT